MSALSQRAEKDKHRASEMKRLGIVRATHRCPLCYHIVSIGIKHFISCRGGK